MSPPVRAASAFSRAWVRLYTARLPEPERSARRAEIAADLWDHQHDRYDGPAAAIGTATEIILRTCLGVVDDLAWRSDVRRSVGRGPDHGRFSMLRFSSRQTRWMGLAGLAGSLLWAAWLIGHMQRSRTQGPPTWGFLGPVGVALVLAGLMGFLASYRERLGRTGTIGVSLVTAGLASYFLAYALGGWLLHDPILSILGAGFVFLPIPGFVLLGLALNGLARMGALLVAVIGPLGLIVGSSGLVDSRWLLGGSQVNLTYGLYFMLAAAWLAAAGYVTFRRGALRTKG